MSYPRQGHYDRAPVWVPFTSEQGRALMGSTDKERQERREAYARLMGPPVNAAPAKRKGLK